MAITIETSPTDPILTGNPAFVEVSTNNRILTAGSKAEITFNYATQLPAGSHGVLQWNGESYRFDVVASPDDSGFQLTAFNDPTTFDQFITDLRANYYINRDFIVTVISPTAPFQYKLTARKNGSDYSVLVISSLNWGTGTKTAGVDNELADNFQAAAIIYADKGSGFELITEISGSWDDADHSKLYINEVLNSLISLSLPPTFFPGVDGGRWIRQMQELLINYYLELREFYGTPPTFKTPTYWGTESSPKRAVKFQLTKSEFENNTVATDYFTHANGIKFISDVPEKKVLIGQTDYFYVFFEGADPGDSIYTKIDVYYSDGTSSLDNDISFLQFLAAQEDSIWEMAVDWPRILGVYSVAGKSIDHIDVYGASTYPGPTITSSKVTVYLDYNNYEQEHYFLFRNAKNGWSTIAFTGELKKIIDPTREEAALADYSSNQYGDQFTYNHHYRFGYKVGTGLWEKRFLPQLIQFINSDQVYILDGTFGDEFSTWRPVIIDPKNLVDAETTDSYTFIDSFTFKNANREV